MQRCQLGECLEATLQRRVQAPRGRELESSVDDAVSDGIEHGGIS